MSTYQEAKSPRSSSAADRHGDVPWMTLLAVAGLAAAAFFLLRKYALAGPTYTLESALEQCESAASALEHRVRAANGALVG